MAPAQFHHLSANKRRVQCSWPSGAYCTPGQSGGLHPDHPTCDTDWLGDGRAAHLNPSSAYRRLVRNTVRGDVSRAAATWEALQPASVLSRMRTRLMTRAERWPLRINPQLVPIFRRQPYRITPQPWMSQSVSTKPVSFHCRASLEYQGQWTMGRNPIEVVGQKESTRRYSVTLAAKCGGRDVCDELRVEQRSMAPGGEFPAGASRLGRGYGQGQPELPERRPVGAAQRRSVERPAPGVRQLEKRPQAFHPLGQGRNLGENLPSIVG